METGSKLTKQQSYWRDQVKHCETSGQSMTNYAKQYDLNVKKFYNWKSRLLKLGLLNTEATEELSFQPVKLISPTVTQCRIYLITGDKIDWPIGGSPKNLSQILTALRDV